MIEVRGLSHRPISSGSRPKLFERLDLTLAPGEIVWLSGRNGAGKTTLARYLAGLLIPTEGSVTVDGFDTRDLAHLREVRRRVGLLFQESHAHLVAQTPLEEVAFGLENLAFPPDEIERRARAALERVGLGSYAAHTVEALIPAERQRLALAGLLALKPRYFIFDEPDIAADDRLLRELILLFKELRSEGHGILLISHREFPERFYDRALRLEEGRLSIVERSGVHEFVGSRFPSPLNTDQSKTRERSFVLEARNLSFAYEGSSGFVLRDLSCSVGAGEFIVLQGRAGAGKSTFVQLLAGLEEPTHGEVVVNGRPIRALRASERVRLVGLVFQEPSQQLLGESVAAEIELGLEAQNLSASEREARARWACESVGLDWEELRARSAQTLSGGEQARLAIAAILALDPQMLILDETLYALDPDGQRQILTMLQQRRSQGKTILLVVSSGFEEWAERLWVLEDGQLRCF
ncbi:MAG: energy-coupling factor ABC transporter ATP-binding protein [Candidatus Bipolaricaulota bacterium]|nr:energy-coupling factor ABC transporter ATP-binding protein [Candidatus Bipolaricaulota bacterium]